MTDKRTQIIEAAIKLFAEKGFHAASIQEITDTAGVAKGSMYFYFKSKDELLLSIYKYYHEKLFRKIEEAGKAEGLSPKQKLAAQLKVQFESADDFKHFITMQMKEQFITRNEDIKKAAMQMKATGFQWMQNRIEEIYGEPIRPWLLDSAMLFQSMITSYMGTMILHHVSFDFQKLADFLIDRLDDIAEGLIRFRPDPMLQADAFHRLMKLHDIEETEDHNDIPAQLAFIRNEITRAGIDEDVMEELLESLQAINDELQKEKPRKFIISGMIHNLLQAGLAELDHPVRKLQAMLNV